jgi:hypothetical protein
MKAMITRMKPITEHITMTKMMIGAKPLISSSSS